MKRVLAIDFGLKRIGVAVTDPMQLIATGLTTVQSADFFSFLKQYLENEDVETIVVGESKNLDNSPTQITKQLNAFKKKLKETYPEMKIASIDERFTSKLAFQSMIDSGLSKKKRRNKELVDEISAVLILQTYMDRLEI